MEYRSIVDLYRDIMDNLHRIPADVDVVVGIPRSGLLAANIISLALNLPLAEPAGFAARQLISSGKTRRHGQLNIEFSGIRHALVVDDSLHTGGSLAEARASFEHLGGDIRFSYAVVYTAPRKLARDVIEFKTVSLPRIFEWNLFHHPLMQEACMEIEGVLCRAPLAKDLADPQSYAAYVRNARLSAAPTQRTGHLVTCRPERFREDTAAWLMEHDISYDKLVMAGGDPDVSQYSDVAFKGEYYRQVRSRLFIEQSGASRADRESQWQRGAQRRRPGHSPPLVNVALEGASIGASSELARIGEEIREGLLKDHRRTFPASFGYSR